MSKLAKSIRVWYRNGNWTLKQVQDALAKGRITQAEFDWIVGE